MAETNDEKRTADAPAQSPINPDSEAKFCGICGSPLLTDLDQSIGTCSQCQAQIEKEG